jgi:hypothetical protein
MHGVIDEAEAQAKEFVLEAFAKTAKLGPGGFEGFMAAAIKSAEKQLALMEAARLEINLKQGKNMSGSDNRMKVLVFNRAVLQTMKRETERLSCFDEAED